MRRHFEEWGGTYALAAFIAVVLVCVVVAVGSDERALTARCRSALAGATASDSLRVLRAAPDCARVSR